MTDLTVLDETDPATYAPSDAEAALTVLPIVRTRRTLSGKRIHEVIDPQVDAAEPNLRNALDNLVSRIRDAKDARDAEVEAEATPGAPVQVTVPDGNGDRHHRRAYARAVKRAQHNAMAAQSRRVKPYLRAPQPGGRARAEARRAYAREFGGQS